MGRPDRDEWHLRGAAWLAEMGDCTRRQVGALIVGPDKRLWGSGYNGADPGGKSCLAGDCPRGRHYRWTWADKAPGECICADYEWKAGAEHHWNCPKFQVEICRCGNAWPCYDAVLPGSSYDTGPGTCINSHAESNAKADAMQRGGGRLEGCTMYVSCEPCEGCIRDIRNTTGITAIIWPEGMVALP